MTRSAKVLFATFLMISLVFCPGRAQEAEAVTTDPATDGAMVIGSCVPNSNNFLGNCVGECKSRGFNLGLCVGNNGGVCRCSK